MVSIFLFFILTFASVWLALSGRSPGEVVVKVLTHLAVQAFGVVGTLALTMHLKQTQVFKVTMYQ